MGKGAEKDRVTSHISLLCAAKVWFWVAIRSGARAARLVGQAHPTWLEGYAPFYHQQITDFMLRYLVLQGIDIKARANYHRVVKE
jgi:hypothetical protein